MEILGGIICVLVALQMISKLLNAICRNLFGLSVPETIRSGGRITKSLLQGIHKATQPPIHRPRSAFLLKLLGLTHSYCLFWILTVFACVVFVWYVCVAADLPAWDSLKMASFNILLTALSIMVRVEVDREYLAIKDAWKNRGDWSNRLAS